MSDSQMLQILIDGQAIIRDAVQKLDFKIDNVEKRLTERLDNLGMQIAELEDDAPTSAAFDALEKRVRKLEAKTFASA